jgi:hypothetical protein
MNDLISLVHFLKHADLRGIYGSSLRIYCVTSYEISSYFGAV